MSSATTTSAIADLSHLMDGFSTEKVDPRLERLQFHTVNARSRNTNLAYRNQWTSFTTWCDKEGLTPFPAEASTLVLYLDSLVEGGYKGSTVQQALQAIKAVHADHDRYPGARDALAAMNSTGTRSAINSLRRILGSRGMNRQDRPRAFTQAEIELMSKACSPDTHVGVQEKALLLLGCNAGLRASEFGAMRLGDLSFDSEGLEVLIPQSKSDQDGLGETLFVGRLAPSQRHLDAVAAMEEHLAKMRTKGITVKSSDPVFIGWAGPNSPYMKNGEIRGITRISIAEMVRRIAGRVNLSPSDQRISSHSLRHTFITQCFRSPHHISELDIAKVSRHKNLRMLNTYNQQSRRESSVSPRLWS